MREALVEQVVGEDGDLVVTVPVGEADAEIGDTVILLESPQCAATLRRARLDTGGDFIGEHRKIIAALRDRDPKAARQAIHSHLAQLTDDLLVLAEVDALQETRQKMAEQRRALSLRTEI